MTGTPTPVPSTPPAPTPVPSAPRVPGVPNPSSPTASLPSRLTVAVRNGWRQARIEMRSSLRNGGFIGLLITPAIAVVVVLVGGGDLDSTGVSIAQYILPGLLAMGLVVGGMMGPMAELMMERDDGSLVRMKAVPGGLQGYVFGKVSSQLVQNLLALVLMFLVLAVFEPVLLPGSAGDWLRFLTFVLLGLLATIPVGIAAGSAVRNAALMVIPMLLIYGLVIISGVFFPIAGFATWLQWIVMVFPVYWLGMGLRSAFLPAEAGAVEIAGSFQVVEAAVVLGIWALIGLVLAPILLRRMIRGVSGATVAEARDRMLSRGY